MQEINKYSKCAWGNQFNCEDCTHLQVKEKLSDKFRLWEANMMKFVNEDKKASGFVKDSRRKQFTDENPKPNKYEEHKWYCGRA